MTITGEVTVSSIVSGATLLTVVGVALRGAVMFGRLTRRQEEHSETLASIKSTLGNGSPGTVVRTATCEKLHQAVTREIQAVREDVRELREVVIAHGAHEGRT